MSNVSLESIARALLVLELFLSMNKKWGYLESALFQAIFALIWSVMLLTSKSAYHVNLSTFFVSLHLVMVALGYAGHLRKNV